MTPAIRRLLILAVVSVLAIASLTAFSGPGETSEGSGGQRLSLSTTKPQSDYDTHRAIEQSATFHEQQRSEFLRAVEFAQAVEFVEAVEFAQAVEAAEAEQRRQAAEAERQRQAAAEKAAAEKAAAAKQTTTTTAASKPAAPSAAPAPAPAARSTSGNCGGWEGLIASHFSDVGTACRVMMCESEGNPNAVNSSSGASGLFQVMPSWASRYQQVTGVPYYDGRFSPNANAAFAAFLVNDSGWASQFDCY